MMSDLQIARDCLAKLYDMKSKLNPNDSTFQREVERLDREIKMTMDDINAIEEEYKSYSDDE